MDPEKLNPLAYVEWKASLTGSLIRFGILTALFVGILVAFIATGSVSSVKDNWSRYRCSPFIMPFAELFGFDSAENFQFCVRSMMQSQSGEMFSPIYGLLGQFGSSLGIITNTMNGFRGSLGQFKLSTDSFLNGVMSKFQALLYQIRIMFMRMQTLMGRVYSTMYSVIYMGTSAITAGTSLADNDLVNFMFEFCFAPTTRIRVAGGFKEIQDLRVGDEVVVAGQGRRVLSTFRFKGDRTPMVQIGTDVLSAEHRVHNLGWIPARLHPSALPTPSIPLLYCLNVEGHELETEGLRVADYDESSRPEVTAATQQIAETALNGGVIGTPVKDYSLGYDPAAEIWMADRTWKPARDLRLGDHVYGGAEVLGLVEELAPGRVYGGVTLAGAQLVYIDDRWRRGEDILQATDAYIPLVQCVTDRAAPLFIRNAANKAPIVVRDYREAPIPDMEKPYLTALADDAEN